MKRLKKGPELKMPELKVPPFVSDLYWDLRDRRLLPLIALAVVAIAAVPFLLGGGSEAPPARPPLGIATPSAEREAAEAASLTVVQAKPGLRDYRKRLAARTPTDPFKQRYTASSAEGAELGSSGSSSSSVSSTTTVTTSSGSGSTVDTVTTTNDSPPSNSPPSKSQPSGSDKGTPHLTLFTWAIDVQIARTPGENWSQIQEPTIKRKVLPQTPLPGDKAPVVTYMGLSRQSAEKHNAAKALLLVSDDVTSVEGDAACAAVGKGCHLLEVEPDSALTFVYGPNGPRYTIKVLKIELVVTGHT